jgi:hypothetical protein
MRNLAKHHVHKCTCAACQAHPYSAAAEGHRAINRVVRMLDERNRRRFVGLLARQWGRGGVQHLLEITGISRNTIIRGRDEVEHPRQAPGRSIRRPGGGRQPVEKNSRAL